MFAVHGEAVYEVELSGAAPELPPLRHVLAVGVVLDDARVPVAVAEVKAAVRQESQYCGIAVGERARVRIRPCLCPGCGVVRVDELHHQITSVIGELEDLHVDPSAAAALDDPDMALWIIRTDVDLVGLVQDRVPLRPSFQNVAVPIDDHEVVRAIRSFPPLSVPIPPNRHNDAIRIVHRNARHLPPGPRFFVVRRRLPPVFRGLVFARPVITAFHDRSLRSRWRRGLVLTDAGQKYRQPSGENKDHTPVLQSHDASSLERLP